MSRALGYLLSEAGFIPSSTRILRWNSVQLQNEECEYRASVKLSKVLESMNPNDTEVPKVNPMLFYGKIPTMERLPLGLRGGIHVVFC